MIDSAQAGLVLGLGLNHPGTNSLEALRGGDLALQRAQTGLDPFGECPAGLALNTLHPLFHPSIGQDQVTEGDLLHCSKARRRQAS